MKKIFTLLFCTVFYALFADKFVVDTLNNVDLLIDEKVTEDNHSYAEEFFVYNKNERPILFSIKIKEAINGKNTLIKHPMTIAPGKMVSVGIVEQADHAKEADWSWEWSIKLVSDA